MADGRELMLQDRLARLLGIEILEMADGRACAQMKVEERHLNGLGAAQGGALFALADFTFACAVNSRPSVAVAIQANILFFKAGSGTLRAEASEVSLHPKLGSYLVRVTDEQGDLVALFEGLAYRKSAKG